jgi:putative MFS transporter
MTDFDGGAPARFKWLLPGLRPPPGMTRAQERTFLLVGMAALFAGFDQNVYGFAIPQIQASLHIPENQIGLTITWFRFATLVAMAITLTADVVGRRRLLLITLAGQAAFTLATAFSQNYAQFVWLQVFARIFSYAEEILCVVVVAEEVAAGARGWAAGTLAGLMYLGAGVAAIFFAAVNILPGHWRALYVIGGCSMVFIAFLRRSLPETKRFQIRHQEVEKLHAQIGGALDMIQRLVREYPGRLALIFVTVAAWGFAVAPAAVLAASYLQKTLGFKPWQTTALLIPGGLVALWFNIMAGRASDRFGRKRALFLTMLVSGVAYAGFFSGLHGWLIPPLWIVAFFGLFTTDALARGFSVEIVPTAYRATVGGMAYCVGIMSGGISLALEGVWYDHFHAHGPAISLSLLAIPIAMIGVLFLPEPAGKVLEEISGS